MLYRVNLDVQGKGIVEFEDSIFDGLVPRSSIEKTNTEFVQNELKLCDICTVNLEKNGMSGSFCHVLVKKEDHSGYFTKHCPVLFQDLFQRLMPIKWKIEHLL
jgi:hypothetical protein